MLLFLSTALGIFFGNRLLQYFQNKKEKIEKASLLVNAINQDLYNLMSIYTLISSGNIQCDEQSIALCLTDINNNELFSVAFKSVGIYEKNILSLISNYYVQLKRSCQYIQKLLIQVNQDKSIHLLFVVMKITSIITALEVILSIYVLKNKYSSEKKESIEEEFFRDYTRIIYQLRRNCAKPSISNGYFPVIDIRIGNDLVKRLKYIKEKFEEQKSIRGSLLKQKELYICLGTTKSEYRARIDLVFGEKICSSNCIITFANSKEEAIRLCKKFIRTAIIDCTKLEKERVIHTFRFESTLIFPSSF